VPAAEKQVEDLWKALGKRIKAEEDSIRAYELCDLCEGRTRALGVPRPRAEVPEVYIVE
jgi:CRISPR/Cas system-associated endoribonuclease Cas2